MTSTDDLLKEFPSLRDVTAIADYNEIRQVLTHPSFVQGAYHLTSGNLMSDVLNTLDGEEHRKRRRLMARLFSERALSAYRQQQLEPTIRHSLQELAVARDLDGTIHADLVPLLWHILFRVAAAVTGIEGLESVEAVERFIELVSTFGNSLTVEWSKEDPDALIERGLAARRALAAEFFEPSAARRRHLVEEYRQGRISETDLPNDLITMLYLHWDPEWDDELPMREVSVFLMAATQTTTQAFPHMIVQLEAWIAGHPEYRERILSDDVFLRRAAYETLRLFVASPARIRRAVEDVTLDSGRFVASGERVALFFKAASMQAEIFGGDPGVFDPLREQDGIAPWGLAFGGGAHACVGRPMVAGVGSRGQSDGTIVYIARALYEAGLRLDPEHPPTLDQTTYYDAFDSVPVIFDKL